MMCRVGSVVAPFCVYLSSVWIFMPQMIVGIVAFVSGLLTLMLPETLGKPLTNTWAEAIELGASSGSRTGKTSSSTEWESIRKD